MAAALLAAWMLVGCAVEWRNREVVREEVQRMVPPGSVYAGWRVFQDKCASCHGPAATGTAGGPDLLPRVREMSERRFVGLVLQRYDWGMPGEAARAAGPAQDALIEDIVQRRAGALVMPAWQNEPRVNAHIVDLYAYLSARAAGTQGPGRPLP